MKFNMIIFEQLKSLCMDAVNDESLRTAVIGVLEKRFKDDTNILNIQCDDKNNPDSMTDDIVITLTYKRDEAIIEYTRSVYCKIQPDLIWRPNDEKT